MKARLSGLLPALMGLTLGLCLVPPAHAGMGEAEVGDGAAAIEMARQAKRAFGQATDLVEALPEAARMATQRPTSMFLKEPGQALTVTPEAGIAPGISPADKAALDGLRTNAQAWIPEGLR